MNILTKIKEKYNRNIQIYSDALQKGKIVGYDYTWLLWKNHTKFLLRIRNPKDKQKVFNRMNQFWESFADVIKKYENEPIYPKDSFEEDDKPTIWIYWNDISHIPPMVKSCMTLIRKNSNGCRVVVVSEDKVSDYLDLDSIVWEKYKEGKISRTHFSDIVRIALLAKYGGVWMDCTLLLTQPLPSIVTEADFYTNKLDIKDDVNVCAGRWSTFFIACHKNNLMMKAALDVFVEYWKRYDDIADYVWMDYIFNMLYNHIQSVKEMIDNVPMNNPNIWILQTMISKALTQAQFNEIFNDKTRFMYKLSFKDSINAPLFDEFGNKTLKGWVCSLNDNQN